jgi:septal ring factor EnvC (AmiA/AmiB activator)
VKRLLPGLAAAAVATLGTWALAQGSLTDDRLKTIRDRRAILEKDLARLRGQEKSLLGEVEQLEVEVRLRGEQLRETQIVLQRANEQMDATVKQARALETSLARTRPVLAARARALYKLGELSYVRMLLSVDRPADILRGYRFVSALARRDNQRVAGFRADLQRLTATRAELERKTAEALTLRTELARARRALDADRRRKSELLTSLVEKKETNAAYLQELQDAEGKLGQLLAGLGEGDVAVPMAAFKGALPWPVAGRVRLGFGRHKHPRFDTYTLHNGIDIETAPDTPVAAVHEGTVVFSDRFRGYGLMVVLDHGSKLHTLYAQLGEARVQAGEHVPAGGIVGTTGSSGVEGPGLYFEVRAQGRPQDPAEWLARP